MTREDITERLQNKFNIKSIFRRHAHWIWSQPRETVRPCSKCGTNHAVWCVYGDSGVTEYDFEYFHICLDCGNTEHSSYNLNIKNPTCPLCGKDW